MCDKPDCFDALKEEFKGTGIHVLRDGHAVSRLSTFIIYSVEAAALPAVVKEYGPSTRVGAVVAGQTSVKAPEREAFEKWLPEDVGITSVHSLHGPSVTTEGQPLVSAFVFFFLVAYRRGSRADLRGKWVRLSYIIEVLKRM